MNQGFTATERIVQFRPDDLRVSTTGRVASDLFSEADDGGHVVGVWMLNVPSFPGTT